MLCSGCLEGSTGHLPPCQPPWEALHFVKCLGASVQILAGFTDTQSANRLVLSHQGNPTRINWLQQSHDPQRRVHFCFLNNHQRIWWLQECTWNIQSPFPPPAMTIATSRLAILQFILPPNVILPCFSCFFSPAFCSGLGSETRTLQYSRSFCWCAWFFFLAGGPRGRRHGPQGGY